MGRFRLRGGPFWMWLWAVLVILKICGPFWSGPFCFMGRFGRFPQGLDGDGVLLAVKFPGPLL